MNWWLFGAQSLDWIESGGAAGGQDAGGQTDEDSADFCQQHIEPGRVYRQGG